MQKGRTSLNQGDIVLRADTDGVRIINHKTGGRMDVTKIGREWLWHEEPVLSMEHMHEQYNYNQ